MPVPTAKSQGFLGRKRGSGPSSVGWLDLGMQAIYTTMSRLHVSGYHRQAALHHDHEQWVNLVSGSRSAHVTTASEHSCCWSAALQCPRACHTVCARHQSGLRSSEPAGQDHANCKAVRRTTYTYTTMHVILQAAKAHHCRQWRLAGRRGRS